MLKTARINKNISSHWGSRGGLSNLKIKDFGDRVIIVFGYLNGAIRVGMTDGEELTAHDGEYSRSMRSARMLETILSSNVHTGFITDIDIDENSHQMVVASGDGTASIWNIDAWLQRRTDYQPIILDDHEGWVTACIINSEEDLVFTSTKKGVVKFWSMDPAYYADKICRKLEGRSLNPREWSIYIGNEVPFEKQICK
jgi:WD40 repeat protein